MNLVGRQTQRERLRRAAQRAAAGHGGCVELIGQAGAGKTSVLDEFAEWAATHGFRVTRAAVTEWEQDFPWATLTAVMASFVGGATSDDDRVLADLVASGRHDGTTDPFRVALASLRALSAAAEAQPLVVLVDDLHWADSTSVEALALLSRRLQHERVLLVTARREVAHLRSWGDAVQVPPLDDRDLERVLRPLVPHRPLRQRIVDVAGGLPLVAVVVAHALTPAQRDGNEPVPEILPIGSAVGSWYGPMLATLDSDGRIAATVAAAEPHGDRAAITAALQHLGLGEDGLLAAEAAGLLLIDTGGVGFVHPTAREAVYEAATPAERRRAHGALADALANHESGEWTWHRLRSLVGTDEPTAAAATAVAATAARHGAHRRAAELFRRAAQCTPPGTGAAGERWLAAATAAMNAGDASDAADALQHAERHGAPLGGLATLRARVLAAAGDPEGAHRVATEAAPALAAIDSEAALLLATEPIGVLLSLNRRERVVELATLAESLMPDGAFEAPTPGTPGQARAWIARGVRLFAERHPGDAAPYLAAWQQLLSMVGASSAAPYLCSTVAIVYSYTNQRDRAVAMLESLLRESRSQQAGGAAAGVLGALAVAHYGNDFRACMEAGDEMLQLIGDPRQAALSVAGLSAMAFAAAACGDQARCDAAAHALIERDDPLSAYAALAKMALFAGDPARALELLAQAEEDPRSRTTHHRWHNDHAEANLRLGRTSEAHLLVKRLVDDAAENDEWARGQACRIEALMADGEEAAELFRRSTEHLERNLNRYALALAYFQWGQFARRQRRRAEARRHLDRALQLFTECGASGWIERCHQELQATGGQVAVGVAALPALTTIETTVANLIASGASNREIGGHLFISPRTVETHVSAISRKLGVKGRTAIAAWVHRTNTGTTAT